jgi:hypothetical protein
MNLENIYLEILIGQVEMINSVIIGFKSLEFIIVKLYSSACFLQLSSRYLTLILKFKINGDHVGDRTLSFWLEGLTA